jgi:hypothetical protein
MMNNIVNIVGLLKIEREAYPSQFQMMQDCKSIEDIADYCECSRRKLLVLGDGATWYALIAKHKKGSAEFVDVAKLPGTRFLPWEEIIESLRTAKITKIYADLRHNTSYKLLKKFAARFGITILKEKEYYDSSFGETMHEMVLRVN